MNTRVSFKVAKRLKELQFNEACNKYFQLALTTRIDNETGLPSGPFGWEKGELTEDSGYFVNNSSSDFSGDNWLMCAEPTISQVVMWIWENHRVWIYAKPQKKDKVCFIVETIDAEVKVFEYDGIQSTSSNFNSITEAYEAAVEYVLNSL